MVIQRIGCRGVDKVRGMDTDSMAKRVVIKTVWLFWEWRMTKPIVPDAIYRKRAFNADIIELCVRWYITHRLSYRDLVEMMAERHRGRALNDPSMGHAVRPRIREALEPVLAHRRYVMDDEKYISIKAKWHYRYRAVDGYGKTVAFLLRRDRGIDM
jgi:transposase-like protein